MGSVTTARSKLRPVTDGTVTQLSKVDWFMMTQSTSSQLDSGATDTTSETIATSMMTIHILMRMSTAILSRGIIQTARGSLMLQKISLSVTPDSPLSPVADTEIEAMTC